MNPKHLLLYVLIPLLVLAVAASYYRFIVKNDYFVEYQTACDPAAASCYVGLNENQENYYYAKMHKYAPDLMAECGKDITGCQAAGTCRASDRGCFVTYCSGDTISPDESCYAQGPRPDTPASTTATSSISREPRPL